MDIPIISRMSDLEASINSLKDPSFISRIIAILEFGSSQAHRFWKYGALLVALVYAFSSVASRIKIFILQHRKIMSSTSQTLSTDYSDDEAYSDDDDDDDDDEEAEESSCSSEDEIDYRKSSYQDLTRFEEEFRVAGVSNLRESEGQSRKFMLRRRRSGIGSEGFSFSEVFNCKSVVKLFDDSSSNGNTISIFDLNKSAKISSIFGILPAVTMSSPAVIVSASRSKKDEKLLGVNVWDVRMRRRVPAVHAEWRPRRTGSVPVVGVSAGGVDKIFVSDDVSQDFIGDMRKVNSPLEDVTEYDKHTTDAWWDAEAVLF
ncbi:hypothetical protein Ancab_018507 [Ancistrocladus abbreviatus]